MTRRDADNRDVDAVDTAAATGHGAGLSTRRRGLTTAGWATKGRLDVWHRLGAVVFGVVCGPSGVSGWSTGSPCSPPTADHVLGLSSNGLLSVISLVVGAVLIGAAVRGGRAARPR